jgi:hypothetical protein
MVCVKMMMNESSKKHFLEKASALLLSNKKIKTVLYVNSLR